MKDFRYNPYLSRPFQRPFRVQPAGNGGSQHEELYQVVLFLCQIHVDSLPTAKERQRPDFIQGDCFHKLFQVFRCSRTVVDK